MKTFLKEFNDFLETTSVHGLFYINKGQTRYSRIIWSLIVLSAAGIAGYFLYETISGFEEKFTSTTIETRSVKQFPFPAVTFHAGDYNSKDIFLRTFLNQFEFSRYDQLSPLRKNSLNVNRDWTAGALSSGSSEANLQWAVQIWIVREGIRS